MLYRNLGDCEEKVSALGFGCMRLPVHDNDPKKIDEVRARTMLQTAIEGGVNYIDTAYPYHSGDFNIPGETEPFVGRTLQGGARDEVMLATKLPPWLVDSRDDMERILDHQLERLQTDYIDCYLLHALNQATWAKLQQHDVLAFLDDALADGRIRRAGFSFHGTAELFQEIVDAYAWSFCQIQYSYLDEKTQAGRAGLEYAAARGLGVVIMEPLRGGNLAGRLPEEAEATFSGAATRRSHADWALRWVWDHPQASKVLCGMSSPKQVEENLRTAADAAPGALTDDDRARVAKVKETYRARQKVPCTRCRYCTPCPEWVAIPATLSFYNEYYLFDADGSRRLAKTLYTMLLELSARADRCTACGRCLEHCPQQIAIPDALKETVSALGSSEFLSGWVSRK